MQNSARGWNQCETVLEGGGSAKQYCRVEPVRNSAKKVEPVRNNAGGWSHCTSESLRKKSMQKKLLGSS